MSIRPLPEDVRVRIQSSVEITSLLDVVEGLLRNALDAGASSVSITVHFAKGFCAVQDDGSGIPSSEFSQGGNLARIHCTSKLGSLCYGSHGRFLACISALSLLSISSQYRHESTASNVVLKQGEVIARHVGSRDEELGRHGTKVIVHNLFGNIPVRFKQQATTSTEMVEFQRQFDTLKWLIVSYLLAVGRPVNLRLRSTGHLQYNHTSAVNTAGGVASSTLHMTKILRQAGFTTPTDTWKLASAKAGDISVRCAISLTPGPSKRAQFVSLGQYPIPPRGIASIIYDTVNAMFDASAFGVIKSVEDEPASRPDSRKSPKTRTSSLRKGPGKGVDRWPAFYIRIRTKATSQLMNITQAYDRDDSLPSLLQEILALLKLLISRFLQTHSLRAKHVRASRRMLQPTTASRQPQNDHTSFDRWKRMKSANNVQEQELCSGLPFVDNMLPVDDPSLDDDVQLLLKDIELDSNRVEDKSGGLSTHEIPVHAQAADLTLANAQGEGDSEIATWRNPRTGKVLYLDARNGCVAVPAPQKCVAHTCSTTLRSQSPQTLGRRLPSRPSTSAELAERLKRWPAGSSSTKTEPPIPSLVQDETPKEDENRGVEQRIEATQLAYAQVLRQVDNKFILAMLSPPSHGKESSSLVLIDQHAADERVKVEEFFQQLCSCQCMLLARPIVFEVRNDEAKRLEQARPYFASWAIDYHVRHRDVLAQIPDRQTSIVVTHLPALIAERCRLEPSVLIQMLRKQIWSKHTARSSNSPLTGDASWISRVSQCPEGLVEMINSRACRTAIMFNDALRNDQCEELLRRLSSCVLPFQCAHGRPNITILTTFGQEANIGSQDHGGETFGEAFRRWSS